MESTPDQEASQTQGKTQQDESVRPTEADTKPANNVPEGNVMVREIVKYIDKPQRRITEIHVFYDDGTFETFSGRKD